MYLLYPISDLKSTSVGQASGSRSLRSRWSGGNLNGNRVKVGNRAGHAEDFVVRPGRKPDRVHRCLEQLLTCTGSKFAKRANLSVRHLAVSDAYDFWENRCLLKCVGLQSPPRASVRTAGAGSLARTDPGNETAGTSMM